MKAGLITFHFAHHYGAQLQAYALMKSIEGLGVECEIINYVRPDTIEGTKVFKSGFSPRSVLSNLHSLLHYSAFKNRKNRFSSFINEQMKLSKHSYNAYSELEKNPPIYDLYVCGSDQIWNPLIFASKDFDPSFFMPFAGNRKRIAYAPSFGISSIPDDKKETLKNFLSKFDFLSVREPQGAEIINDLTGRKALVVLDPTLLLTESQWSEISSVPTYKPYILCYFVTDPTPYFKYIEAISSVLKLPIVCLCGSRKVIPGSISTIYDAGSQEFLGLFKNAAYVCTNSFHGTVFSIIFKKNFYCFKNSYNFAAEGNKVKTVNSRLYSMLETLGLTDRFFTGELDSVAFGSKVSEQKDINFTNVTDLLNTEREKSLEYLRNALFQNQDGLNR